MERDVYTLGLWPQVDEQGGAMRRRAATAFRPPARWPLALLAALMLGACSTTGGPGAMRPRLDPPDPRPIVAIDVADDTEVDLLRQQLGVDPVRLEGGVLYLHEDGDIAERLRAIGYLPHRANAYAVFRRVVRVRRRGEESALASFGVALINREPAHWVVEGTLGNLRALERAGFRLTELGPNEPSPREIRIRLRSVKEVQRIAEMNVDIFNVTESRNGVLLTGAAFDAQIDRLQAAGFEVERAPSPSQGERP